jgi:arylsulfatase A-like enzyme
MVRNGRLVNEPGYVTDAITREAIAMLDAYAERGGPFYLGVHYTAPHSPHEPHEHPKDIVESYADCPFETAPQEPVHPWAQGLTKHYHGKRGALQGYYASITAMDAGIGRILARLEEHGLADDTLVMFFGDNGYSCGQHGFWGKGNATLPRNMYENSIRVPALFSHPARMPAGRLEQAMVSAYDFMPTLLDYLDLPLPRGRNLPGTSFAPALEGRPLQRRDHVVVFDEYGPVRMIRSEQWKYVYRHAHGPHELWDLVNDPDERRNLIADPEQAERVAELHARMDAWFARYVDPEVDGLAESGTQHGQLRSRKGMDPAP